MSDEWSGPYVRVPWEIIEETWYFNDKKLAAFIRRLVAQEKARRSRRRSYVPSAAWLAILVRFDFRCAYCGTSGVPLEREHRMPIALGGPDTLDNIVPACRPCNQRKRIDHPDLWPIVVEVSL